MIVPRIMLLGVTPNVCAKQAYGYNYQQIAMERLVMIKFLFKF